MGGALAPITATLCHPKQKPRKEALFMWVGVVERAETENQCHHEEAELDKLSEGCPKPRAYLYRIRQFCATVGNFVFMKSQGQESKR